MSDIRSNLTQGSILKTVWSISWPMVSTYFLQTLVSLVDIKMVGSLGQENIAAVGLATAALMIVLMLMMGISTGTVLPIFDGSMSIWTMRALGAKTLTLATPT